MFSWLRTNIESEESNTGIAFKSILKQSFSKEMVQCEVCAQKYVNMQGLLLHITKIHNNLHLRNKCKQAGVEQCQVQVQLCNLD